MKKLFCIIVAVLLLIFGATACTNNNPSGEAQQPQLPDGILSPSDSDVDDVSLNSEVLVVYFSCSNTTKSVAEKIAISSRSTLYRIVPEIPYTSLDLNYSNDDCRANKEQNDPYARPAIADSVENISQYNTVFIGYPIWWGKLPKIIYTFMDTYDLSGKTIVPFCTSGGSGISASVEEFKREIPDAKVLEGKRFTSSTSQSDIDDWIESLDLKKGTEEDNMQIKITIGENILKATLEDNSATAALKEKLRNGPITINMSDYGGWEKVGDLGFNLPTTNEQITAYPCEFVLYQSNQLVIFYGTNRWSYTRLGKITGIEVTELKAILGKGNVIVTLSL